MELYIDKVLGAKERPSPATLAQWAPLAALLTVNELKVPPWSIGNDQGYRTARHVLPPPEGWMCQQPR